MGKAVRSVARVALGVGLVVAGAFTGNFALVAAGVGLTVGGPLNKSRGSALTPFDPKSINPDKAAPRKIVFGRTAIPLDLRHAEPSSDSKQEYITYIFALAGHRLDALESLYIEEKQAWNGSTAVGEFAGYLTMEFIPEGGAGAFHVAEGGTKWNSSTRMTGCATLKMRVKRSDNSRSSQSPFASGIPGRMTLIGRGMPVYDPARDSTVAGGSGTQRANDRTTWAYTASSVARGNNPALQLLAYLLGWTINGIGSVGLGIDPARLNLPSFAAAAAICDESVALAAGGSHRRYEAGKAYTDADDPGAVIDELLAAMNGELVHDGGKLALRLGVNDLTPVLTLTEADFLSGYEWQPAPPLAEQHTVVRGRYSQPDAPSLFGLSDYPEVSTGRTSVAPRPLALELPNVQDSRRAERIATQVARMSANWGRFTVTVGVRGWGLRLNAVVALTIPARGWTAKLFRVRGITLNQDALVNLELRPEFATFYSWGAAETNLPAPVAPVPFNNANAASWLMGNIAPEATRNLVDGTTLDQTGDTLLVKTAGVNTPQLAPNAATIAAEYSQTGTHTVSGTPTWGNVVLSSATAQVTLANDTDFAASVVMQWVCLLEQSGSDSDRVDFRMVYGAGPTPLGMLYSGIDISGGSGRRNAIPLTFRDTIPANTTRTYTLQARSNDSTNLVQATCDARMDKRT